MTFEELIDGLLELHLSNRDGLVEEIIKLLQKERKQTLEEAAKVAEGHSKSDLCYYVAKRIAQKIRELGK